MPEDCRHAVFYRARNGSTSRDADGRRPCHSSAVGADSMLECLGSAPAKTLVGGDAVFVVLSALVGSPANPPAQTLVEGDPVFVALSAGKSVLSTPEAENAFFSSMRRRPHSGHLSMPCFFGCCAKLLSAPPNMAPGAGIQLNCCRCPCNQPPDCSWSHAACCCCGVSCLC